MNAREQDIITIIRYRGPMTSAGLHEWLTAPIYGHNLEVKQISKIASKMKSTGLLTSEDRPNPGAKPVRYWALPEADHPEDTLKMVSDEAVTAVAPEHRMNDFLLDKLKEIEIRKPDYDPITVAFPSKPMSAATILKECAILGFDDDRAMGVFMEGIAASERYHGISE